MSCTIDGGPKSPLPPVPVVLVPSRRLAAIMFTDMVGYARITEHDEARALSLVHEQERLLRPLFEKHRGRVVKTTGDGFLVEFDSALDATVCSLEARDRLRVHNRGHPDARIETRIGIHVGDVVEEGGDVFGDAVNVASRVEPLADAGGVCVSQAVYEQVANKVDTRFRRLDRAAMKNIDFPWAVYRLETRQDEPGIPIDARVSLPLVEREKDLARLREASERLAAGEGGVLLVTGEAGIGKTRLLRELGRLSAEVGMLVAVGHAHEGEFEPPLTVWVEALRTLVGELSPSELMQDVGLNAFVVGRYVPELVLRLGGAPAAPEVEPEPFVLFGAVTKLLANASRRRPLLLFLEDLQWADEVSLRLLEFVVRNTLDERLLCIGSYRSEEFERGGRLPATVLELSRTRPLGQLEVGPLSEAGVATLLASALGTEQVAAPLTALVHERTGGNPLFVDELAWALKNAGRIRVEGGRATLTEGPVQLPQTVQPLIERRVRSLSPGARELLRTASVLGARFDAGTLEAVAGLPRPEFLDSVEEALRAGILRERPAEAGASLTFADARLCEHLYTTVSFLRRRALHSDIARALEASGASADQLAYHYDRARQPAEASVHFERAGDEALALGDYHRATERFARGLADCPEREREARRRLGVKLGRSLQEVGRYPEALEALLEARRAVDRPADDVPIAVWLSAVRLRQGRFDESRAEMESALRTLGEATTPEAADAWSGWAVLLCSNGEVDAAIAAGQRTLALSRQLQRPELVSQALNNLGFAYTSACRWDDAVRCVTERLESADEGVRPFESAVTLLDAAGAYGGILAEFPTALAYYDRAIDRFRAMGIHSSEVYARLGRAGLLVFLGRLEEAEREIAEGLRRAADLGIEWARAYYALHAAEIEWQRGDLDAAAERLRRLLSDLPVEVQSRGHLELEAHHQLALVLAAEGDREAAREEIRPWWGTPDPHRCGHCGEFTSYVAAWIEAVEPGGDPRVFDEAVAYAMRRGTPMGRAMLAVPRAMWARHHGAPSEAALVEAQAFLHDRGVSTLLADTLAEHARTLEALGDAAAAASRARESAELYERVGSPRRAAELRGSDA